MGKNLIIGLCFFLLSVWAIPVYGETCNSDTDCPQGWWCYEWASGYKTCRQCDSNTPCPQGFVCNNDQCVKAECTAHCDCPQGSFCYHGKCVTDPQMPVHCCAKPGCPPGGYCVTPGGASDRCPEDESFVCESACDCGPAHACIEIPNVGKRCVKDVDDPWLTGGTAIFNATIPDGEPTYCCAEPECFAGRYSYGNNAADFACYDKYTQSSLNSCGGKQCFFSGDCERGDTCVDVYFPKIAAGTSCSSKGGRCISNAVAEAVFNYPSSILVPACKDCGPEATYQCAAGWKPGGAYMFRLVIGQCGSCGNGTCEDWESYLICPEDCKAPPADKCGDGICNGLETRKNCPEDCTQPPVCGDGSCDPSEVTTCPKDCACPDSPTFMDYLSFCGDGYCDPNPYSLENCLTCPNDCGAICPVALCQNVTVNAGLTCTASASIDNGSYIPDGSPITLTQSPAGPYPKGNTLVTLIVTNIQGGSSQCTGTVTVKDKENPVITDVSASPSTLWPANHKMVPVTVTATASDNCGVAPVCGIISVASNEPGDGLGDGDTAPDWQFIPGSLTANLRAERSGKGNGRTYAIGVQCSDLAGNASSQNVTVTVPKDQGKK